MAKMAQGMVTVSVIMPVYNGLRFMSQSLPPLMDMREQGEVLEVIVVDDGSTDGSRRLAEDLGCRVLRSGGRLGPGGARNQAGEVAQGDVLWFVDADVVVHADAARKLRAGFEDEGVVAVFGSYDDNPPAKNFFSRYKNLVHHYYHHKAKEEAQTFWSGCGAIRRQAFLEAGGFNVERYRYPSIEDIELGHRIIKAGGRIRLLRHVQCTHLKVWRLGNLIHTEIFRRAIPWSRLIINSGDGIPNDLNVGMAEQLRAVVAGIFALSLIAALLGLIGPAVFVISALLMLVVNSEIALFFKRRGGLLFAIAALLFHQFYYIYSASAFAWVVTERIAGKLFGIVVPS
ncbi:MAG: glycosyltransferase family 2 protein [Halioglobus sp.]|nr:glycosyltransferase family 2 protein [Halioglobus sp.]